MSLPNSIFSMLIAQASSPNSKIFPQPFSPESSIQTIHTVIQTVARHYAKVKKSQLKTHPTPILPVNLATCPIAIASLNFLNTKIASYLATL